MGCMQSRNGKETSEEGTAEQNSSFDISETVSEPTPAVRPRRNRPDATYPSSRPRGVGKARFEHSHQRPLHYIGGDRPIPRPAISKQGDDRRERRLSLIPEDQTQQHLPVRRKIYEEETHTHSQGKIEVQRRIIEYDITNQRLQRRPLYCCYPGDENPIAHSHEHQRPTEHHRPNTSDSRPGSSVPLLARRHATDERLCEREVEDSMMELDGCSGMGAVEIHSD